MPRVQAEEALRGVAVAGAVHARGPERARLVRAWERQARGPADDDTPTPMTPDEHRAAMHAIGFGVAR